MEILTAYIRKNSRAEGTEVKDVTVDIQAILNVMKRRRNFFGRGDQPFGFF